MKGMNGTQIRDWRKARKLTQIDLAELLGVHRATLIRWEQGEPQQYPKLLDLALESVEAN